MAHEPRGAEVQGRRSTPGPTVLALDLSLTSTGVAMPDGSTFTISPAKLSTPPTEAEQRARLVGIRNSIRNLCTTLHPDVVVLEGMSYGSKGSTIDQTFALAWIVRIDLGELDQTYTVAPPSSLKKYALGKGGGKGTDKDAMGIAAMKRGGLDFSGRNDECDAWWLWVMARHAYGHPLFELPAVHLTAIDAVTWPDLLERAA